jgi:predicted metal-dependent phosphoesterase TrpH
VSRGEAKDFDAVFKKYLGKGKKAHVKPQWISMAEAVKWIQDAGGLAVLAHPGHYDLTTKWLRRLVTDFASGGGDGMEVTHSHLSREKKTLLAELAQEHKLRASAGSDFHYPNRWTELGKNLSLPSQLVPIWQDWKLQTDVASEL